MAWKIERESEVGDPLPHPGGVGSIWSLLWHRVNSVFSHDTLFLLTIYLGAQPRPKDAPTPTLGGWWQGDSMRALFSALPHEVLADKRLTPADKVTYAAMASEIRRQGVSIVSWENTELAALCHLERRSIGKSIRRLAACGHVSTAVDKVNGRPTYWLKSDVFLPKSKLLSMPRSSHKK